MDIVRLQGLGKLKKFNDLIGNRTRDLPAYTIIPQTTTLPGEPICPYEKSLRNTMADPIT
jgi:hypothetical protein